MVVDAVGWGALVAGVSELGASGKRVRAGVSFNINGSL